MITDKHQQDISKLIEDELSFTNGWVISEESYTEHCIKAAKRIRRYLQRSLGLNQILNASKNKKVTKLTAEYLQECRDRVHSADTLHLDTIIKDLYKRTNKLVDHINTLQS